MHTIKSSADIDEVFSSGTRFGSRTVGVIVKEASDERRDPSGRVAYVAGRRVGCAVRRNRGKRVLREVARELGLPRPGYDVVLLATRHTGTAGHAEVVSSLSRLLGRAGLR